MTVRVRIDARALRRAATAPGSPAVTSTSRRVKRAENMAKRLAPVDKGRLRASIHTTGPRPVPAGVRWDVVADVAYALWIHTGRRRYRRGSGRVVYARRGPRPFLTDALKQVFG